LFDLGAGASGNFYDNFKANDCSFYAADLLAGGTNFVIGSATGDSGQAGAYTITNPAFYSPAAGNTHITAAAVNATEAHGWDYNAGTATYNTIDCSGGYASCHPGWPARTTSGGVNMATVNPYSL
jgi:hypothetical protein